MEWLDSHPDEEAETYEEKQKEFEEVANPIMTKMYQNAGGEGGMPGGMPGAGMPGGMPGAGMPGGMPGECLEMEWQVVVYLMVCPKVQKVQKLRRVD